MAIGGLFGKITRLTIRKKNTLFLLFYKELPLINWKVVASGFLNRILVLTRSAFKPQKRSPFCRIQFLSCFVFIINRWVLWIVIFCWHSHWLSFRLKIFQFFLLLVNFSHRIRRHNFIHSKLTFEMKLPFAATSVLHRRMSEISYHKES